MSKQELTDRKANLLKHWRRSAGGTELMAPGAVAILADPQDGKKMMDAIRSSREGHAEKFTLSAGTVRRLLALAGE